MQHYMYPRACYMYSTVNCFYNMYRRRKCCLYLVTGPTCNVQRATTDRLDLVHATRAPGADSGQAGHAHTHAPPWAEGPVHPPTEHSETCVKPQAPPNVMGAYL